VAKLEHVSIYFAVDERYMLAPCIRAASC